MSLLIKLIQLLNSKRTYWLYPIIFSLLILSALKLFTDGSRIVPWIYTFF